MVVAYDDFKNLSTLKEDKMRIFDEQSCRPTIKYIIRESPTAINNEKSRRDLD